MSEAEEAVTSLKNNVTCSICLETLYNPLTLECGHSFCQKCIHEHWDRQEHKQGSIECPQCRLVFRQRPEPQKNVILCKVLEDLKVLDLVASANTEVGLKVASTVCLKHNRELSFYCRTEKRCICSKCFLKGCQHHDIEDIEDESKLQKSKFLNDLQVSGQQKELTEQEIVEWNRKIQNIKEFHESAVVRVMSAFDKVQKTLEECQTLVIDSVRCEEKAAVEEAMKHLHLLQQHSQALNQYHTDAQQLLHTSDAIFLEGLAHLAPFGRVPLSPNIPLHGIVQMEAVTRVLPEVTRLLQEDLPNALHPVVGLSETKETSRKSSGFKINDECSPRETSFQSLKPTTEIDGFPTNMSDIRAQLHKDYRNLTFDPETANKYIELAPDNHKAKHNRNLSSNTVPDSPKRFLTWQVMCSDGFSEGSHYWEVEVSDFFVQIGVAYESLKRTIERENCIGKNSQSWSLELVSTRQSAWCNNKAITLRAPMYRIIGVHLDITGDSLTFYGVKDEGGLERLHTFHTLFTEKVYPAFFIGEDISVKICHINNNPRENVE